ncbi:hypothetical protein AVEN_130451-1, partial [Araneus ventricosus]
MDITSSMGCGKSKTEEVIVVEAVNTVELLTVMTAG